MKRKLIIGIILIALIIAIWIGFELIHSDPPLAGIENRSIGELDNHNSNAAGSRSNQVVMMTSMPKTPEKILVYRTVPPDVNKATTLALAKKFNVTGTLRGETTVQSEDLVYAITLTKNSGSIEYLNQNRPNTLEDSPDKLPSDEEAEKIATKFLDDRDLLPEGASFGSITHENTRGVDKSGKNTIYYGEIGVWYNRTLNGMDVEGTQYVVYLGGKGDIIGFFSNWREYSPYSMAPIESPQIAVDKMQKQGISVGTTKPDAISIDNVYLAYATKAGAENEEYLEPVWVFKGDIIVNNTSVRRIAELMPALTDESVKSLSL